MTKNIRRYFKLVNYGLISGIKKEWATMLILVAAYIFPWVLGTLLKMSLTPQDRDPIIFLLTISFSISLPARIYGHITDPLRGMDFVLLPATMAEKFAAMITVITLLLPFGLYVTLHLADFLLYNIPDQRGFSGPLQISVLSRLGTFFKICGFQALFFLGNLLLKKKKTVLSLLCAMVLYSPFLLLIISSASHGGPSSRETSAVLWVIYIYLLPLVFWILSYHRLRTLQLS